MSAIVAAARTQALDVRTGRQRRRRRHRLVTLGLAVTVVALFVLSLMIGRTFYDPVQVFAVLRGQNVPGASFAIGELRLPRATLGALTGICYGLGGITFQTMLRNPLAAPDIIGITSGASAAGVIGIVVLSWSHAQSSLLAIVVALAIALVIYVLSSTGGATGARLILIGIGVSAMLDSVVAYVIVRASQWDLQTAMRWLSGSLNGASWDQVLPVAGALIILGPLLLSSGRALDILQHGDGMARALGVSVGRTRIGVVVAAVALIAFATAASGPITFVAFLAGPIAARLCGMSSSLLLPSALVGAALVLAADLGGQWAFGTRYPVGVVTGVLGAPYLILLLIRFNRSGGSL